MSCAFAELLSWFPTGGTMAWIGVGAEPETTVAESGLGWLNTLDVF